LIREVRPGEVGKKCSGPLHRGGVWLSFDSFGKNGARNDGLQTLCRECDKISSKKYRDRAKRWLEKSGRRLSDRSGFEERLDRFIGADNAQERIEAFIDD